ncbi:MAG: hypothetical protein J0626_06425, partial [Rhodospirillaceae bacterium]|nr:hypothetical protein [Rhodospirillaceae bacterium]
VFTGTKLGCNRLANELNKAGIHADAIHGDKTQQERIKALEAFLGVALFQRYPQGVKLTEAGKRYAQRVRPPLEQLTLATQEITSTQISKTVLVTILPALAQLWLGPRMDHFHKLDTNATGEIWA